MEEPLPLANLTATEAKAIAQAAKEDKDWEAIAAAEEYTRRLDWFAGLAMQGILAKGTIHDPRPEVVAKIGFSFGLAMMEEATRLEDIRRKEAEAASGS